MKYYVFEIISDAGVTSKIRATSRSMAIQQYSIDTGIPESFIKKHCVVRKIG